MKEGYTLQYADTADLSSWMALVTLVRYNFPGLETDEELEKHKQTVIKNIHRKTAICVKHIDDVVGVLIFSPNQNCLSCVAVHPRHRRNGIATAMVKGKRVEPRAVLGGGLSSARTALHYARLQRASVPLRRVSSFPKSLRTFWEPYMASLRSLPVVPAAKDRSRA